MFGKVLVANRGEIAIRVMRTLEELGIASVAVYSEPDRDAPHARRADEAFLLGPGPANESYLVVEKIIDVAQKSGAEAIHPGYGFLAENADFAAAVEAAGLAFVGPSAEQIRTLGDKRAVRALALEAGVPVVPGAEGGDPAALARAAKRLGFPVMVKAALGGGGKGMSVVAGEPALGEAIESAQRIALSAFGDPTVYLEQQLERPRHVEVQVLGDGRGGAIHLFERECSLQRRHQKVIEESPAPSITDRRREELAAAAVKLARAARYRSAGTVEFLITPGGEFFFLEMNTRLQVEHPVTELVTGLDLVRLQLEIAATGELSLRQAEVARRGHAIEARIYAEDAARNFLPQAGEVARARWPRGPFVRVDAGVESGDAVPVQYDPILAKLIALGAERAAALHRLATALDDTLVHGVVTNLPFLRALARAPEVQAARFDTEWIEREFLASFTALATAPAPELALAAAALAESFGGASPARSSTGAAAFPRGSAFESLGRWRHPGLE